jgi:tetratricopeptide (TPR) repeat protein
LLFNLALAQFRAGHLDDALASAEKSRSLGDTADLEDLIGDIHEAQADNVSAAKSYQAAIALAPNDEKYRLSLALELIQHKSFEPAKVVLEQAEATQPNSWKIRMARGMIEYFLGNDEASSKLLLQAADLSPDPVLPLKYLGDVQMYQAASPDPASLAKICKVADDPPHNATMEYYCGALVFKTDSASGSKSNMTEVLRRLKDAAHGLPNYAPAHCQLGKAYHWMEQWDDALRESEVCARLAPDSPDAHYRLMQIYRHMGQTEQAKEQARLYEAASKRVADDNARRDETIKTFVYTIGQQPSH